MSDRLYTLDILRLAADSGSRARLASPAATVERRSPTCGSRIVVDLTTDTDGRVSAYGHEVRACALGQASAALLASHIVGRTPDELADASRTLAGYLSGARGDLGTWPGLEVLAPARDYPARHASIRLAFEAAAEAAAKAQA